MYKLLVDTINGKRFENVYNNDEIELFKLMMGAKVSTKKKIYYLELPCAFDIETTNIYKRNEEGNIDNSLRPYAFMYHWQFCIRDQVTFGRTWPEFQDFLKRIEREMNLSYNNRLVVYVHNLAYEWQFMRFFVKYTEGFFKDNYKPLKVLVNGCIEFRDSYALSNMNLAKFCENERGVTHYKLSGDDYNYDKIRTQEYEMTSAELAYCYNDVRGLAECIRSRMADDTLAGMPLTSTGYVRREARKYMSKNEKNRTLFINNQLDDHLYTQCRQAFRGGDTHANLKFSNQRLENVQSFDITSSYPYSMMCDLYPTTAFFRINISTFLNRDLSEYAYLITFRLKNIRYKGACGIPYIAESKCTYITPDRIIDNGRVLAAEWVQITCTDIDYKIIISEYDYEDILYNEVWCSKYGSLSSEFKECLMTYYRDKTKLKGVEGQEYELMKSKNRLNSLYGMMVMRIDQTLTTYNNGVYEEEPSELKTSLEKYYKSRNSFLSYQHGVWVTANARRNLREMLNIVGKDVVYCDTDSVKCVNDHRADFDKKNREIIKRATDAGAFAEDKNGVVKYLGVWDYEGCYKEFKTLGAKKYVVKDDKGYHSTIAGVSKKIGEEYFNKNGIDSFKIGTKITDSGHLVAYYNDDKPHYITVNGCKMLTAANVALVNDSYTIGVTSEYLDLLEKALANVDILEYN